MIKESGPKNPRNDSRRLLEEIRLAHAADGIQVIR